MSYAIEKGEFRKGRKTFRYKIIEPTGGETYLRSVTEILEWVMGKGKFGAGAWWGQEQGVKGTLAVLEKLDKQFPKNDWEDVIGWLKNFKLTTNHVRDNAAARGTAVHDAAEQYAKFGAVPNPADFPTEQQGYVRAFARWIVDYNPTFLATEVVVASKAHAYAGTYDIKVKLDDRVGLGDYKTGKRLYDSVFFQLEAYEVASVEMGEKPTDFRFAVHLGADGEYTYEESVAKRGEWLSLVDAYQAQSEFELRRRGNRKR